MAQQPDDSTVVSRKLPKFTVIDFEFANLNKDMVFLISGAISQSDSEESDVTKFQGIPIQLTPEGKTMQMTQYNRNYIVSVFRKTILKKKPSQFEAFMRELENSFKQTSTNLTKEIISSYFTSENECNIVTLWNGNTDRIIIDRLDIWNPIVNLEAYDVGNNKNFYLRLTHIPSKQLIAKVYLGQTNKNGRFLSLFEAHAMVCSANHETTSYVHDPVVDVKLTKCLFNFLLRIESYEKVLARTLELVT